MIHGSGTGILHTRLKWAPNSWIDPKLLTQGFLFATVFEIKWYFPGNYPCIIIHSMRSKWVLSESKLHRHLNPLVNPPFQNINNLRRTLILSWQLTVYITHTGICMYIYCKYACMYVCMYACMHACMYKSLYPIASPIKSHRIPWNPMKSHEIPWNPMKSHQITLFMIFSWCFPYGLSQSKPLISPRRMPCEYLTRPGTVEKYHVGMVFWEENMKKKETSAAQKKDQDAPWCWNIYLHDWVIFRVNVGKYSIHGASQKKDQDHSKSSISGWRSRSQGLGPP